MSWLQTDIREQYVNIVELMNNKSEIEPRVDLISQDEFVSGSEEKEERRGTVCTWCFSAADVRPAAFRAAPKPN